ncbi:hypothetical protein, partial [Hafnia alvei]|uniref:hypothetical protein n=1 Tax=Hafnia alvei TaxID=569 RepID=UPI001D0EE5D9
SAPGRHAPSLAPPPLVETSCFYCSIYQDLNNLKDKKTKISFVFLSFVFFMLKECILESPAGMLVAG